MFQQIYINLDAYNDADYVNFDMAEGAQWNESRKNRPKDRESGDSN